MSVKWFLKIRGNKMAVKPTIQVKAYFSSSIRGEKGSDASQKEIDENIRAGKKMGAQLREYFGKLLNLYVPHDQDDLVQILWRSGRITVWDILDGDCKLVQERDLLLVWKNKGYFSTGMKREIRAAQEKNIPIIEFEEFNNDIVQKIFKEINKKVFGDNQEDEE